MAPSICCSRFGATNGAVPLASLIQDANGNFYGTTLSGGASNLGPVFQVGSNGDLATLVSFAGPNGAKPIAGLALGGDGTSYGTTWSGGRE